MREGNSGSEATSSSVFRPVAPERKLVRGVRSPRLAEIPQSEVLAVLRRAYSLILKGWCRCHMAVDATGRNTFWPEAQAPVAWSLLGAVKTGTLAGHHAQKALSRLTGEVDIQRWNDHPLRTKRQVLDVLSVAIGEHGGKRPRVGGWRIGGAQ